MNILPPQKLCALVFHTEKLHDETTWRLLCKALDRFHASKIKATFLVYPHRAVIAGIDIRDRIRVLADAGHEIGQHTHFYAGEDLAPGLKRNDLSEENINYCLRRDYDYLVDAGIKPTSFTAGGWLINLAVVHGLLSLGFTVDCSARIPPGRADNSPYHLWLDGPRIVGSDTSQLWCIPTMQSLGMCLRNRLRSWWGGIPRSFARSELEIVYLHDYDLSASRTQIALASYLATHRYENSVILRDLPAKWRHAQQVAPLSSGPQRQLEYVADVRLPTEKAHGYQICKMSEAFANLNLAVTLIHPFRYQHDAELANVDVYKYYGIAKNFKILTTQNHDLSRAISAISFIPPLSATLNLLSRMLWAFRAAKASLPFANVYFAREIYVALFLVLFGRPTALEIHVIPKRGQKLLLRSLRYFSSLKLLIALTTSTHRRLIDLKFPENKVLVAPDAVDLRYFESLPDRATCRVELELDQQQAIIGYIGRFITMDIEKGIPELIEAAAQIYHRGKFNAKVLCVGGPMAQKKKYESIAQKFGLPLKNLLIIDRVPPTEVGRWMRACDVVTIPWPWNEFSAYFTSPLKLFEYMASGTPIVASDLPSLRDILRHHENSLLVRPSDVAALGHALEVLLSNPELRNQLATKAQRDVAQFTWNIRARKILEALEKRVLNQARDTSSEKTAEIR